MFWILQIHFYSFEELVWQFVLYEQGIRLFLDFDLEVQMQRHMFFRTTGSRA